jgi:hypothetical protein
LISQNLNLKITLPNQLNTQKGQQSFENYFRIKAWKIEPILIKKSKLTVLEYNNAIHEAWKTLGSCTSNTIIININAIKLPFSLIEYLCSSWVSTHQDVTQKSFKWTIQAHSKLEGIDEKNVFLVKENPIWYQPKIKIWKLLRTQFVHQRRQIYVGSQLEGCNMNSIGIDPIKVQMILSLL